LKRGEGLQGGKPFLVKSGGKIAAHGDGRGKRPSGCVFPEKGKLLSRKGRGVDQRSRGGQAREKKKVQHEGRCVPPLGG